MSSVRILQRSARYVRLVQTIRPLSTSGSHLADARSIPMSERCNDTAEKHREYMMNKPLNPHLTNTTSTIANEFPDIGSDKPPADMLTSVDPKYTTKDSVPENTARMTGGTQKSNPKTGSNAELDVGAELSVGELEGNSDIVEPLRREGEEKDTLRARLIYQSRKRGTLESDLLLSTFADKHLWNMTKSQMQQFDLFLDENDWDIYYWATQQPTPTSRETAEGGSKELANANVRGKESSSVASGKTADEATAKSSDSAPKPSKDEWAQTWGAFKPAYRPVPSRWRNSEILSLLRKHVIDRSAGGVHFHDETEPAKVEGESLAQSVQGTGGGGLGMMPNLKNFRGSNKDVTTS